MSTGFGMHAVCKAADGSLVTFGPFYGETYTIVTRLLKYAKKTPESIRASGISIAEMEEMFYSVSDGERLGNSKPEEQYCRDPHRVLAVLQCFSQIVKENPQFEFIYKGKSFVHAMIDICELAAKNNGLVWMFDC